MAKRRRFFNQWSVPVLIGLAILAVWEVLVRWRAVSTLFLPAPSAVGSALYDRLAHGDWSRHLWATLRRVLVGFLIGGGLGIGLGLLMGWSRRLRMALDPIVAAIHPVPKVALLPLFLVVLGLGEAPKLLVVSLAAFFPSVISAMAGVRQISPIHFEVARNYEAGRWRTLTHVVLPGSLPLVLTGSRVALNSAVVVTIAVELAQSRDGLGHLLWIAGETLRVEELYAAVAVAALLGISFNVLLRLLSNRLVPWQSEHQI